MLRFSWLRVLSHSLAFRCLYFLLLFLIPPFSSLPLHSLIALALRHCQAGRGTVVCMAGGGYDGPNPGLGGYGSSKAGLMRFVDNRPPARPPVAQKPLLLLLLPPPPPPPPVKLMSPLLPLLWLVPVAVELRTAGHGGVGVYGLWPGFVNTHMIDLLTTAPAGESTLEHTAALWGAE